MKRKFKMREKPKNDQGMSCELVTDKVNGKWQKITFFAVVGILTVTVLLIFAAFTNEIRTSTRNESTLQLLEVATQSKNVLQSRLDSALLNLHGLASSFAKYDDFSDEQIFDIMQRESIRHGYVHMAIALPDGRSRSTDGNMTDISNREYFKLAMQGEANISNVLKSKTDAQMVIVYAVPIFRSGEIVGVLRAVNKVSSLEKALAVSSFDSSCYTYILKSDGDVVLHPQSPLSDHTVTNVMDVIDSTNSSSELMKADVLAGRSDVREFTQTSGKKVFAAYVPLDGINDWYTVSIIASETLMKKTNYIISLTAFLLLIIAAILVLTVLYIFHIKSLSQKQFEYLAYTDVVTGSLSWSKFQIDMRELLKKGKDKRYAYVFLNVENFKYINDIMGFEIGDDLLKYITKVLSDNTHQDEIFARISADHFSILIEYNGDESIINRLEQINSEICLFRSHYDINFSLRVAYGIYKIKDKTLSSSSINDRALLAMQTVSETKESNYGFYSSNIRQKALLEKELENQMQAALDEKNFIVYLQPKFDLNTSKIVGAEALVRWLHPTRGLIPPGSFIELFENNGFITKLDYYMFEETCKLLRKWLDSGKEPVTISVNLSKVHLYNPNVAEELYCLVVRYNIPPKYIEVELTESMDFDNINMLIDIVDRLKRFDFSISIDDFGTGYSSLNMLKDLPVDVLKIDREFLNEAADQKRGRQVIASIIDMAKRLDMKTVAEGVECKEQADFLINANCDYVQGFFYSQPISINDFENRYIYNNEV